MISWLKLYENQITLEYVAYNYYFIIFERKINCRESRVWRKSSNLNGVAQGRIMYELYFCFSFWCMEAMGLIVVWEWLNQNLYVWTCVWMPLESRIQVYICLYIYFYEYIVEDIISQIECAGWQGLSKRPSAMLGLRNLCF